MGLSLEDDAELKQTDTVVQSETKDELSAAVTQLDAADESLVMMTRRARMTEPSMNKQASLMTEMNREQSAEMSGERLPGTTDSAAGRHGERLSGTTHSAAGRHGERLSGTTDSAAGRHVNMTEGLSVEVVSELSPLEPTELTELESIVRVQCGQLTELTAERLDVQQRLTATCADLQLKDAECRQLRDAVAELERQLAGQTRLLEESRDREDDLQRAVEASQAELRQSDGRWHEVVETKERLAMELRADLDALAGSVQRRENTWDAARRSMEEEMDSMRLGLAQQTAHHDSQVQVGARAT